MKRFLIATALVAVTVAFTTTANAVDIGTLLGIGQPGFYGRIDIGNSMQPQVIYLQPMVIERVPMDRPPIYLRVPPEQTKNWSKYCGKYNACGERVLFVQDNWYNREYVPRYQEQQHDRKNDSNGKHKNDSGKNRGGGRGRDH